jgi:hypothetical protein
MGSDEFIARCTEFSERITRLTVGHTVNYGGHYGYLNMHGPVGNELNTAAARFAGAARNGEPDQKLLELSKAVEGKLMLALTTEVLPVLEGNQALEELNDLQATLQEPTNI